MNIKVRAYEEKDLQAMVEIWNQVVDEGVAFPQEEDLVLNKSELFLRASE